MEIKHFAETILYGKTWADKLLTPANFFDNLPALTAAEQKALSQLSLPGRPDNLSWARAKKNEGNDGVVRSFPKTANLDAERSRGLVLHFFANHELLAMELMALALLKFQDAPASFRAGLARTITEEQRHLRLYLERMRELGVEFGEIAVNSYFWDALKNMRHPKDYVVQMSMTFEQANLDFSWHYSQLFLKLGDKNTSDLLEQVYIDEIGHVKFGVNWFEKWRDQSVTQWQAYVEAMAHPMSPARAKGLGFYKDARIKAGFNADFIDQLEVYQHSKGRPPFLFCFNPAAEQEAGHPEKSFSHSGNTHVLQHDYSSLMAFLASGDDIVLVDEKPTPEFLRQLRDSGFKLPQFVEQKDIESLKPRLLARWQPWGKTLRQLESLNRQEFHWQKEPFIGEKWADLYSKEFSKKLELKIFGTENNGSLVRDFSEFKDKLSQYFSQGLTVVLAKSFYNSSGRGLRRFIKLELTANEIGWIEQQFKEYGGLVLEPWHERVLDFSLQAELSAEGEFNSQGITYFFADKRGQYMGHQLGRKAIMLDSELLRYLHENNVEEEFEKVGQQAAKALAASDYFGPFGVDAYLYREHSVLKVRYLVEVNPRYTMGRVALALKKRVANSTPAVWLHFHIDQLSKQGYASIESFAEAMAQKWPLQLEERQSKGGNNLIASGFFPTNDPKLAKKYLSAIIAGAEAVSQFT